MRCNGAHASSIGPLIAVSHIAFRSITLAKRQQHALNGVLHLLDSRSISVEATTKQLHHHRRCLLRRNISRCAVATIDRVSNLLSRELHNVSVALDYIVDHWT
jgi:hypothetical protein